jgi:succinate dehydrogenase / fumarate reductase flavoprotein subunit
VRDGLGIGGRNAVYLDLTEKDEAYLLRKLGAILDIYEKFRGVDPKKVPMEIYPAYHYSMGGLYAGYETDADGKLLKNSPKNQETNIPGVYAVGEADHQYHGANRLGANSLMSCIFAGIVVGESVASLAKNSKTAAVESSLLDSEKKLEEENYKKLLAQDGPENPYVIHKELGEAMSTYCLIERNNGELKTLQGLVDGFAERLKKASSLDKSGAGNMSAVFLRQLDGMITLAKAIVDGAILRDECRGAHYKPDFDNAAPPKETPIDDPAWTAYYEKFLAQSHEWLRTTIAKYDPSKSRPTIEYKPVDARHLSPEPRDYTGVGKKAWKKFLDKRQATQAKA